ncbi:hypothetical protein PVAG01_09443 [Phlyctema vagabunda]|uniref:Uncharacterized protein n=1 Tax=Phlyctema vagabunda TaxID=108571 RepID=A0ABR4P7D2_9HELO
MLPPAPKFLLCLISFLIFISAGTAQTASETSTDITTPSTVAPSSSPTTTTFPQFSSSTTRRGNSTTTSTSRPATLSGPPDVYLNVPNLSVGRIELDVENLKADINLNAAVAGLVSINAGVQLSVQKINLTIADIEAELELIVRLGNLVEIVNRVFESLDLNPLLISALNATTSLVEAVVGEVEGLLGTITQGGTNLSFLVDNLGNIVQQVAGTGGSVVSTIVGDYLTNMTLTGDSKTLSNGYVQKTYSYSPLNALVNIVFNSLGQLVQATVAKS